MILVVDDDPGITASHSLILENLGYPCRAVTDPTRVERMLQAEQEIDLVLLDVRMPEMSGLELLKRIKLVRPDIGVIMATVVSDIDTAVMATKVGAYNYLLKPLQEERLASVMRSYFSNRPHCVIDDPLFAPFITRSNQFKEIFHRVRVFAEADVTVLIQGETGTGKELIARLVHAASTRNREPFIAVNVAAIPKELFEAELFGHARGAFTSAVRERQGYFEQAGRGTLFLDELGELSADEQKKLLRVLQERRFRRIGESEERELHARVVVATNRSLQEEAKDGGFRLDLYYRLAAHSITLPPLRKRPEDIPLLAQYFLEKYRSQYGRMVTGMDAEAMAALSRYPYPGNVRELEGILSAAVLLEQSPLVTVESLPNHLVEPMPDDDSLSAARYRKIMETLAECGGNQTKAATKLGIARGTLNRLLKKYREEHFA